MKERNLRKQSESACRAGLSEKSLLSYYRGQRFNPVPIDLRTEASWRIHSEKRRNLYERHLRIPLGWMNDRSVIEFGCNSGENAMVLADYGAKLALVEPNEQVIPRLKENFSRYGLEGQVTDLLNASLEAYRPDKTYDLVIAEGFLCTLPNRDAMLRKLCRLMSPGGMAVVTFGDRAGSLLEFLRRAVLWRVCQLTAVEDMLGAASLEISKRLFQDDYDGISASRPFEAWWKDSIVTPVYTFDTLWGYREITDIIEAEGCEFQSTSPQWADVDHYQWYKDLRTTSKRHEDILNDYDRKFAFIITGKPSGLPSFVCLGELVRASEMLVKRLSDYTDGFSISIESIRYPEVLDACMQNSGEPELRALNDDLKNVFNAMQSPQPERLLHAYLDTKRVRHLWGTPHHYLSFVKLKNIEASKDED